MNYNIHLQFYNKFVNSKLLLYADIIWRNGLLCKTTNKINCYIVLRDGSIDSVH